jgi:hypothetical protein
MSEKKAKKGQCQVTLDGVTFVFRKPTLEEYEDYQEKRNTNPRRPGPAYRELAQRCLLDQTQLDALQKAFEANAAVSLTIANTLAELAGIDIEITVGKD